MFPRLGTILFSIKSVISTGFFQRGSNSGSNSNHGNIVILLYKAYQEHTDSKVCETRCRVNRFLKRSQIFSHAACLGTKSRTKQHQFCNSSLLFSLCID